MTVHIYLNSTTGTIYLNIMDSIINCQTFDDLYSITEDLGKKEKGDLFELITYYLFYLSPELNHNLQDIWLYNDIPDEIKRLLHLPEKDKGIDLLALINGEYCAIQCKFRQNPDVMIKWGELGTSITIFSN